MAACASQDSIQHLLVTWEHPDLPCSSDTAQASPQENAP